MDPHYCSAPMHNVHTYATDAYELTFFVLLDGFDAITIHISRLKTYQIESDPDRARDHVQRNWISRWTIFRPEYRTEKMARKAKKFAQRITLSARRIERALAATLRKIALQLIWEFINFMINGVAFWGELRFISAANSNFSGRQRH